MITALTIFLGGSAICGASVNMLMLVIARAVQGLGGGGIQVRPDFTTSGEETLSHHFPPFK